MGEKRMFGHYFAVKTFEHQIDCFCPDGNHAEYLTINKGDIIEVMNERKFTMANGWYFLVMINERCIFFMALEDLEEYFMKEQLLSMFDIDLKINHLQFKINQALDTGDEASFMNFTKKLKESNHLKVKLDNYLRNVTV